MTISVHEQIVGHKVTVRSAARTQTSQRLGRTEQVMPEIRTHLEAALAATQPRVGPPTRARSRVFRP